MQAECGALGNAKLPRSQPMCGAQKHLIFLQKQATEDMSQTLNTCPVCASEGGFLEMALKARTGSINVSFQQAEVYCAY